MTKEEAARGEKAAGAGSSASYAGSEPDPRRYTGAQGLIDGASPRLSHRVVAAETAHKAQIMKKPQV